MRGMKARRKRAVAVAGSGLEATPERAAKPDYETLPSGRRRRVNTLLAFRRAGKIDSAAECAAGNWLEDYILCKEGYADICENMSENGLAGDVHTWQFRRAAAAERIKRVRCIIGLDNHLKLVMLLYQGLSISEINKRISPEKSESKYREHELSATLVAVLGILPGAYETARKREKRK